MGQSNMQGASGAVSASDPVHAPVPRVIKFGSRVGMEQQFVTGGHPLTSLTWTPGSAIGMGLEFGKTLLAAETDPEVVICLINHALGTTAIQFWEPGASAAQTNPDTGLPYKLYDEAVQRALDASTYGVVKEVLWHQGEYNANASQTNPFPEPQLYATRLQALVDNLRDDFGNPNLPFIGGKLSPSHTFSGDRAAIEGALADLPNQRTNTFCVDNVGLSGKSGDTIHFDEASQLLLGQRYAAAIGDFYSDPFLLFMGGFLTPAEMTNPLLIDPNGDNDKDGSDNFLEYAFLTDPTDPGSFPSIGNGTVTVPGEGEFFTISFRQRIDTEAPQYVVQVSSDLDGWASNLDGPDVTAVVGDPVDNGDGTVTVTVRDLSPISAVSPRRFLRVVVVGG